MTRIPRRIASLDARDRVIRQRAMLADVARAVARRARDAAVAGGRFALDELHRARALAAYRAALRRARRLPDPCARHYAYGRFASGFRARRGETSAREARGALGEAERWTRRLRRALWGADDWQTVLELSYGVRGRFKHLIRACEVECAEGAPVKTRRVTRFALPATSETTGETYSLRYLFRTLEMRSESEDESLAQQMRMLRLRVPRYFHPNGAATLATREEEPDESAAEHVRVWPWEATTAEDIASSAPSYGLGFMPPPADWEMVHLALLKTTFTPLARERMLVMDRQARRVYERTFGIERECLVRLDDIPGVSTADFQK